MFKSPVSELFEHFETFGGGFIEMLTLSDLFEYPWLYDCSASDHRCVGAGFLDCVIKVEIRVHIPVSAVRFFLDSGNVPDKRHFLCCSIFEILVT